MTLRFLTSGESHGKCLNLIIDGFPSGVIIDEEKINNELARRQCGYGRGGRMKIEKDKIKFNSGVRHGFSIGSPICAEIENKDSENWSVVMSGQSVNMQDPDIKKLIDEKAISKIRPGHADYAGALKYNQKDIRNILERSSARETTTRVATGAICRCLLDQFDIDIFSHVTAIGNAKLEKELEKDFDTIKENAEKSDVRCADEKTAQKMRNEIDKAKNEGDTLGGYFEVVIRNLPIGIGSHVQWDKRLDGLLAQAIMSIPAVKSVEIGAGIESASLSGSSMHDEVFFKDGKISRNTNNAGGIEGGMTNGEAIVIKAAMKAIPTMRKPLRSIDLFSKENTEAHFERSDTCAVPACAVVAEAMAAIIIAQIFLEQFSSDNMEDIMQNYKNYEKRLKRRNMKNIVLVGMMGAGKTTVGSLLAKKLNRKLIDIDSIIEENEQRSIIDIFKYDGEEVFRQLEAETIKKYADLSDLIISPGGGAIEKMDNLAELQKNGMVIYLKADIEELFNRVKDDGQRPLLQKEDPLAALKELVKQREKFYCMADMTIITDGKTPDTVLQEILEALSDHV